MFFTQVKKGFEKNLGRKLQDVTWFEGSEDRRNQDRSASEADTSPPGQAPPALQCWGLITTEMGGALQPGIPLSSVPLVSW